MPGSLIPSANQRFYDASGKPLVGGKITTYSAGTTSKKSTFQDRALSAANTNPVTLDSRGEATMYGTGVYRLMVKASNGALIYDRDNIEVYGGVLDAILVDIADVEAARAAAISEINTDVAAVDNRRIQAINVDIPALMLGLAAFNERGAWVTGTAYALKDIYIASSIAYVVTLPHTSTNVAADFAAGRVGVHQGATKEELAASGGAGLVGVAQSESGAVARSALLKSRDFQTSSDYTTLQSAIDAKRSLVSSVRLLQGVISAPSTVNLSDYLNIRGEGDATQVQLATGAGLVYQSANGVFDDHPHKTISDFRITGDGTFASFPGAQNGTTTGLSNSAGAHFLETRGMTFERNNIGRLLTNNYSSNGAYNYFRANKIGAKFSGVTSYKEANSYFRYNSDAAVFITGATQNINISGGAIEGNPGRGILVIGVTSPLTLTLDDVYMEGNGNLPTVPAVDIEDLPSTRVIVNSGSYVMNITLGIYNGEYNWGRSVSFFGSILGGYQYSKEIALSGKCYVASGTVFNCLYDQASSVSRGLVAPAMLTDFSVREFTLSASGACFQIPQFGKITRSKLYSNLAAPTYPHFSSGISASVGVSEDSASNYGDGSWSAIQFGSAVGDFNTNYLTLQTFSDANSLNSFRVASFMIRPVADIIIGMVSSGGAQNLAAYFQLKAGKTYKIMALSTRPLCATTYIRIFPLQANAPSISILPIYSAMCPDLQSFEGVVNGMVHGVI